MRPLSVEYHFGGDNPTFPYICALRLGRWELQTGVVSDVISLDNGNLDCKFCNCSQEPRSNGKSSNRAAHKSSEANRKMLAN